MGQITPLSLFIINRVKFWRLVIGLASKALSRILEHDETYVAGIENPKTNGQYTPHDYPKIAKALDCEVHDLLPSDNFDQKSDGSLVNKVVLSLSNEEDMQLVLTGMIKHGFFKEGKSTTEIAKHLYIDRKPEEKVLIVVLKKLSLESKLEKVGDTFKATRK